MPHDPAERPVTIDSLILNTGICSGVIGGYFLYRRYLRRIPTAVQMPASKFKRQTMYGRVITVGDGDNFRFYHTPGGILCGWGWLRPIPKVNTRGISDKTIMIRLNGIDAPESAHFGKPAQKYSSDALQWLRDYVLGRNIRIVPLSRDQYGRIVAEARIWKWNGLRNVSREMLRAGWATVYEGKIGQEFNGLKNNFLSLESRAKFLRRGIYQKGRNIETPAEYKKKHSDK